MKPDELVLCDKLVNIEELNPFFQQCGNTYRRA